MPPSEGPAALDVSSLSRRYGAHHALTDLTFRARAGDVLLVAGPNGAGKSTLLRCVAGLAHPSAGTIAIAGRRLDAGQPESRRPIGLVAHASQFYHDLSLLENLAFAARLHGLPAPRDRARAALAGAGLEERAGDLPRALSRGMLQRAAIARALLHEPSLLLLDEPFTGLDGAAQAWLVELLAAGRASGRATLLVTHQFAEAWPQVTRTLVLRQGRLVEDVAAAGGADTFIARYRALSDA